MCCWCSGNGNDPLSAIASRMQNDAWRWPVGFDVLQNSFLCLNIQKFKGQQFDNAIAFPRPSPVFLIPVPLVAAGFISTSKRVSGSRSVVLVPSWMQKHGLCSQTWYKSHHFIILHLFHSFNFLPFQSLTPFSKSRYRQWKPGKRWIKVIKV